ncbi:UDP-N-acetylmuramoyl-tripeptide--D-alanyl-D-alanine ligase [Anaerococcus sp. mt242]|uniref:UDP-N-acetylmuramoyl-tripeptide--D-alanyl-D- alanine ligase n=1 Tax=Anaerococcus sp. mt242 TaxID=2661917 RepID=UPI001933E604|nr:UDP-N-acetylmuramoyl-tripeptide--D-alanyl-D-alanine ligase [Anaerococcus sp. mt242]MBM0046602.1 UDP-N-acetylmuramoyl-tripeptide--D-alanyl-D-alanine ligase [Anaerococcus sp. mt242]
MIKRTLGHIADMIDGEISDPSKKELFIEGISTDSRTISPANLYIPLIGDVFDGRIFIKECENKGAAAFIIDNDFEINKNITIPFIKVADTAKALRDLATAYRNELDIKIIGITGSNGKTTTKDLLESTLKEKYVVQKTMGNLNNEIGVPKTILSLDEETEIGIIELGTDNFGDIALTTRIAKPDIAMILNIGDSHLHNLKTREGIAKAKMEITEGLSDNGIFVYNLDDPILAKVVPSYDLKQKVMTFGTDEKSDFVITPVENNNSGVEFKHEEINYNVPLLGDHQIYNGGITVMIAKLLGLDEKQIQDGLKKVKGSHNRSAILELDGFDILDDSYKSNPQALLTGLNTTYTLKGYKNKIVVLGDMLELGDDEKKLHYKSGTNIDPNEIHYCLFYGPLSYEMYKGAMENFPKSRLFYFENKADVCDKLKQLITKSCLVFVKGSHGMHMEEIIECIRTLKI